MNSAEEIKQRLDIVSAISDHVQLGKAGRNFRGLCPFHTEKTPSFFVFPEKQSWRCFGCGAGGDVISFVMKKEGVEFGEALKMLASRAGIVLPEPKPKTPEDKALPKLYQLNEAAAQYYHQILLDSPAALAARKYIDERGLRPETIADFKLGFSLNEWESLKHHLSKQGYKEADILATGLIIEKEGRTYDRFRGRLMFSICDAKGRILGFGARALDDSMPKYLNSPESPIFEKSSVLYGIDRAKGAIREQGKVVIVEGYTDVLTAHQNGFGNAVASMGTALTQKQIAMLQGLTSHIYFALDADSAGNAATMRGIEICRNTLTEEVTGTRRWLGGPTQLGSEISIISIPQGKDPDDVIRENPDNWRRLIEHAQPLMDFLFDVTAMNFDLSRPEGKSQLSDELLPLIAGMKDSAVRETYLTKLSKLTGLNDDILRKKVADYFRTRVTRKGKDKSKELGPSNLTRQTGDQLEEYCLSLLIRYPTLKSGIEDLSIEHFERSENREVFVALQEGRNSTDETREYLDAALRGHFDTLTQRQWPPIDKREQQKALTDCIHRLEKRKLKSQYVFEAESALEDGANAEKSSERLTELQRQHTTLG